ncbi:hypothetical protein EON81_03085 [bacterium]|nr:MAG: hypothetical protein EON81_03085 [bacterium]
MSLLRRLHHLHDIPAFVDYEGGARDGVLDETPKSERIVADRKERLGRAWKSSVEHTPTELRSYLNGTQHDSFILGHVREGDRFTLTATDEYATLFAIWGFGIPWRDCRFPFDLVFERVAYVGWRAVGDQGTLSWGASPIFGREGGVPWITDTFVEPEKEGFRWALHYYQNCERHPNRLLLMEAQSMRVVERQRRAWSEIVGSEYLQAFDDFHSRRDEFSNGGEEAFRAYAETHGTLRRSAA